MANLYLHVPNVLWSPLSLGSEPPHMASFSSSTPCYLSERITDERSYFLPLEPSHLSYMGALWICTDAAFQLLKPPEMFLFLYCSGITLFRELTHSLHNQLLFLFCQEQDAEMCVFVFFPPRLVIALYYRMNWKSSIWGNVVFCNYFVIVDCVKSTE